MKKVTILLLLPFFLVGCEYWDPGDADIVLIVEGAKQRANINITAQGQSLDFLDEPIPFSRAFKGEEGERFTLSATPTLGKGAATLTVKILAGGRLADAMTHNGGTVEVAYVVK